MKTHTLKKTSDYSIFAHHPDQQPISNSHVRELSISMTKNGFWPSKPISVFRDKEKLVLIDGHHRLTAATIAKVEVYYVEEDASKGLLIGDINARVKKWATESFVKLYASRGNEHYNVLQEFIDQGLQLGHAASALINETPGSNNARILIREGAFEVRIEGIAYAKKLLGIINRAKLIVPIIQKKAYVEAIGALMRVPEFNPDVLIDRISTNPLLVVPVARRDQALDVIESVYNFRSHNKLPLRSMAEKIMRMRNIKNNNQE
jgi:hypothetical protein